jgi:transcriptional regulator with XRE-family HTH domain
MGIRKLRKSRGWKQEVLAWKSGINIATISAIERGQANPTIKILDKIAESLDSNIEGLLATGRPSIKLSDQSLKDIVAANIRARRRFLGMSINDLASKTGFFPQYLYTTENAKSLPSLTNFLKIAHGLNFKPASLLTANLSDAELHQTFDTVIGPEEVGDKMRTVRLNAGISLFQISIRTGLSPNNYSEIEYGNHLPTLASLIAFSKGMKVSVEELLS